MDGRKTPVPNWIQASATRGSLRMLTQIRLASRTIGTVLMFCVSTVLGAPQNAQAQQPLASTVGTLKCAFSGGVSFIFGSTRSLECVFDTADGSRSEFYKGNITKFGVDIGFLQSGVILWSVIAPVASIGHGKLAGNFGGSGCGRWAQR
jgi:hypothetical protein